MLLMLLYAALCCLCCFMLLYAAGVAVAGAGLAVNGIDDKTPLSP
jgi:hypothetical protein